jgi:acyl carrier protein
MHSAEDIQNFLVLHLAKLINVTAEEIDPTENIENYGLHSAQAVVLVSKLEQLLGFQPSPRLLWNYPSIASISRRLAEDLITDSPQLPVLDLGAETVLDPTIQPPTTYQGDVGEAKHIFLTGGTGYLGAFIIGDLLQKTPANIYCLVRAGRRWSDQQLTIPDLYLQAHRPVISCEETLKALAGSSILCPPLDAQLLLTYTSYLVKSGFLNLA